MPGPADAVQLLVRCVDAHANTHRYAADTDADGPTTDGDSDRRHGDPDRHPADRNTDRYAAHGDANRNCYHEVGRQKRRRWWWLHDRGTCRAR